MAAQARMLQQHEPVLSTNRSRGFAGKSSGYTCNARHQNARTFIRQALNTPKIRYAYWNFPCRFCCKNNDGSGLASEPAMATLGT